ncbi:MAG: type II toxin-antitoxin system RelE/ParE family toxin [Candidatus Sulfotelmatobacter sp.]
MGRRILDFMDDDFMDDRVATQEDMLTLGKAISDPVGTLWRYRIGDFRVICDIQDGAKMILVLQIGHRSAIYR